MPGFGLDYNKTGAKQNGLSTLGRQPTCLIAGFYRLVLGEAFEREKPWPQPGYLLRSEFFAGLFGHQAFLAFAFFLFRRFQA